MTIGRPLVAMSIAAASVAMSAPVHAAPQEGQPCSHLAEIQLVQHGGPYLICGVGTGAGAKPPAWESYDDQRVIAAGVVGNIGDPCTPPPTGSVGFAFDHNPGTQGMYLASCQGGHWVPFRP